MTSMVIDTSVAFKWYRKKEDEDYVDESLSILKGHLNGKHIIWVPDLLFYEIGNILISKKALASDQSHKIYEAIYNLDLQVYFIDYPLGMSALSLGEKYGVTFYDAAFVALAQALECSFITADRILYSKIKGLSDICYIGDLTF